MLKYHIVLAAMISKPLQVKVKLPAPDSRVLMMRRSRFIKHFLFLTDDDTLEV